MALEQRLELKMLQKLILTPQLQQAIKLLQMPQLELSQAIANELVENPLLEEITDEYEGDGQDAAEGGEGDELVIGERPEPADETDPQAFVGTDDTEAPLDRLMGFSVDEYFDSRSYDGKDLGYFSPDSQQTQTLEQYVGGGSDLYDHLTWQLRLSTAPEDVKTAAETVIGNLDENGYLQSSDEEMVVISECPIEIVLKALKLVQGFDPIGVGARDLKECLLLQLIPLELQGSLVENIINNNLKDIEARKYQKIASEYGCTLEDVKNALKVIEGLEPRPGRSYNADQPIYIKPDVYVVKDDGQYRIVLSDENMPSIRINGYYRKLLTQKALLKKEEKEFLNEKLRSAVWLIKSLDHRQKTIYRVTDSILKFQRDFFDHGVAYLKPLNLRDVALDLSMHESTISRATSNKYLSCGHGFYSFRFFFSSGIKTEAGTISSASVKDMIQKFIDEENHQKPLSDQKISDMLKEINMVVARRTIAKYREELNITSQNQRKRMQ